MHKTIRYYAHYKYLNILMRNLMHNSVQEINNNKKRG